MSKGSTAGLVKYVKFLVEAGAMKPPLWLSALERVPPPPLPAPGRRPPTIRFPEDELVRGYYRRHPEASLQPLDLGSFDPPPARRFAARALELIAAGVPRREATARAEHELASAAGRGERTRGVIEQVQAEEEAHLQDALNTFTVRHGHKPLPRRAEARPPHAGAPATRGAVAPPPPSA
jgi:hypothetical protein